MPKATCLVCGIVCENQLSDYCQVCLDTISKQEPCPNHKGGFDCSPFCPICEGNQYA